MTDYRMKVIEENQQLKHRLKELSDFILIPEFTELAEHLQG